MSKKEIVIKNDYEKIIIDCDTIITNWIFPTFPFTLDIYINDGITLNSKVILNLNQIDGNINIFSTNNTNCLIKMGLKLFSNNKLQLNHHLLGNENKSDIELRIIQENNYLSTITTLGKIFPNTYQNEIKTQLKVFQKDDYKIICEPKLIVLTDDVIANHNVTIKSFDNEELFYLESKGIENKKAKSLQMEGFLNHILK